MGLRNQVFLKKPGFWTPDNYYFVLNVKDVPIAILPNQHQTKLMNLIEILQKDYRQFPQNQTYSIYAEDVKFQDPMTQFQGIDRYQKMITFISNWFKNVQMDLHSINQNGDTIISEWTLKWIAPVPWQPAMSISGWSELKIDDRGLIISHTDYWHCSRFAVFQQLFQSPPKSS